MFETCGIRTRDNLIKSQVITPYLCGIDSTDATIFPPLVYKSLLRLYNGICRVSFEGRQRSDAAGSPHPLLLIKVLVNTF